MTDSGARRGPHTHARQAIYGPNMGAPSATAPEPTAAAIEAAVRERDVLWCKALIAALDVDHLYVVARKFNDIRPDAHDRYETEELIARVRADLRDFSGFGEPQA